MYVPQSLLRYDDWWKHIASPTWPAILPFFGKLRLLPPSHVPGWNHYFSWPFWMRLSLIKPTNKNVKLSSGNVVDVNSASIVGACCLSGGPSVMCCFAALPSSFDWMMKHEAFVGRCEARQRLVSHLEGRYRNLGQITEHTW